jgi:hypothetical protein
MKLIDILKENLSEVKLKDILKPLQTALESMGYDYYEGDYGDQYFSKDINADTNTPSRIYINISPSVEERRSKDQGENPLGLGQYTTVDLLMSFYTWSINRKFFGLYKKKELTKDQNLAGAEGLNIDLGSGMFDIPVEEAVQRIVSLVKKGEAKIASEINQ